jgi:L-iditol 2-dehydrogenase
MLLIGMDSPIQTLPISTAALREVELVGVFRSASNYDYGLEVLADKTNFKFPNVAKLVIHRFKGLENVPGAFAMAAL